MKIYHLCLLLILPFFISCSNTADVPTLNSNLRKQSDSATMIVTKGSWNPENAANPYDLVGRLHNALYERYYEEGKFSASLSEISSVVERRALENENYVPAFGTTLPTLSQARLSYLLDHSAAAQSEVISASVLEKSTQTSFDSFLTTVSVLADSEDDYAVLYDYVVAYEASVLNDAAIDTAAQEVILVTTSVVRYSLYERKKKPKKNTDPEWDLMIGSFAGSVEGSGSSQQHALLMALIVGIAAN